MRILDAGALIALDRGDRDMWALIKEAQQQGFRPALPAPIIGQVWRGGARQARLARVLAACEVIPADGSLSTRAGEVLAAAETSDVLDAMVAVVAADRPGWEIVTSDPNNIHHLLESVGIARVIRRV